MGSVGAPSLNLVGYSALPTFVLLSSVNLANTAVLDANEYEYHIVVYMPETILNNRR